MTEIRYLKPKEWTSDRRTPVLEIEMVEKEDRLSMKIKTKDGLYYTLDLAKHSPKPETRLKAMITTTLPNACQKCGAVLDLIPHPTEKGKKLCAKCGAVKDG